MRILIVEPGRYPRAADIPHTLEAMQKVVGGYIQAIYPWEDRASLVCDGESLLKQCRFNRMVGKDNAIFGTFFLCGLGEEDFTDLPDELLIKYERMFHMPEVLARTPGGYVAFPAPPDEEGELPDEEGGFGADEHS